MKKIFKYVLDKRKAGQTESLMCHPDLEIIECDIQEGWPCFWAIVDTSQDLVEKRFRLIATGREIRDNEVYRGTFHFLSDKEVWHLFEEV